MRSGLTGHAVRQLRHGLACVLAVLLFAIVFARGASWVGLSVWESAVWGAIVGAVVACGDRRGFPRPPAPTAGWDPSGVLGSTVDTPPAHTIIQP